MKSLTILGSTGSIGGNTLEIVADFPERYQIVALTAAFNTQRLATQIARFSPRLVAVYDAVQAQNLRALLSPQTDVQILYGEAGYLAAATHPEADMVVAAMVGAAGLKPTLAAIEAGKDIALANKETLVTAGPLVMQRAAARQVRILPVDSEHSAIFQCLAASAPSSVRQIYLTCSGGPLRTFTREQLACVTPDRALKHPNWRMGAKISIDSATLMNKGLEVIEACHLFDLSVDLIRVVVHPESIVHSMVGFCDGTVIAQLGRPDMKPAIAYALSYPERLSLTEPPPDFCALGQLTFEAPDAERFPCLNLAFRAARTGGTLPAVMNAANEIAVEAFLAGRIPFGRISEIIELVMKSHPVLQSPTIDDILQADETARLASRALL